MEMPESRGKSVFYPQNPWALLFQAIGITAFGIVLVAWPDVTVRVVMLVFGIFAIIWGSFEVFKALYRGDEKEEGEEGEEGEGGEGRKGWLNVILAAVALVAGILALAWPSATERIILIILGIWFLATGVLIMVAGLKLPKDFTGKWVMVVFAVIALGFGIYLLVRPEDTSPNQVASVVVTLIGVFAILEGLILAAYSFMLRRWYKEAEA
ncbi:MAG: DUF308 domain-containing protein [Actinomycetota bacterium]|nr:DUF308 domain-containing protein [Actinomycetota bacterium]